MKNEWVKPELHRIGDLGSFVQTGNSKTGTYIEGQGGGSGEEPMKTPTGQN